MTEVKLDKHVKGTDFVVHMGGDERYTYGIVDNSPSARGYTVRCIEPSRIKEEDFESYGEYLDADTEDRESRPSFRLNHLTTPTKNVELVREIVYLLMRTERTSRIEGRQEVQEGLRDLLGVTDILKEAHVGYEGKVIFE